MGKRMKSCHLSSITHKDTAYDTVSKKIQRTWREGSYRRCLKCWKTHAEISSSGIYGPSGVKQPVRSKVKVLTLFPKNGNCFVSQPFCRTVAVLLNPHHGLVVEHAAEFPFTSFIHHVWCFLWPKPRQITCVVTQMCTHFVTASWGKIILIRMLVHWWGGDEWEWHRRVGQTWPLRVCCG